MKITRSMKFLLAAAMAALVGVAGTPPLVSGAVVERQSHGTSADQEVVAEAFEAYEAIRVALASDEIEGVSAQAEALAPLAGQIAGGLATQATAQVAAAEDLEEARTHFGALSMLLVPRFLEADLPDVHGFTCTMKDQPWAQRTDEVQNPYYGKNMLTCGSPIE